MKSKKNNSSVRKAGYILTLIVLVTAILFAYVLRQKSINDWSKRTENLSLILAEHSGQVMFSANTALDSILDSLKAESLRTEQSYSEFASRKELYQTLLEKTRSNPLIDVATYVDKYGNVLNFTRSFPAPKINLANRDYFQWLSKNDSVATYYSAPVENKGNSDWVFYLARRVNDADHHFIGLVLVGVSVKVFSNLYKRIGLDLGKGSALALYRSDMTLLTRWPYSESMIGKINPNMSADDFVSYADMNGEAFITDAPNYNDNDSRTKRMISMQGVDRYPLFVTVSVQDSLYLKGWSTSAAGGLFAAFLILIVLVYGIRLLDRSYKFNSDIKYTAMHDALTGLPNRHLFFDRFTNAIALAKREKTRLAVLFIDINDFKMINDQNSHAIGDLVLKEVSDVINSCIRASDTVGRIGGDEFMVLLPHLKNKDDACYVIEKIHHALAYGVKVLNHSIQTTVSIGAAVYPEDGVTVTELSEHADSSMYLDKKSRKEHACYHNVELLTAG